METHMTTSDSTKTVDALPGDFTHAIRRHLGNRRFLLAAAIVALIAGAALNWGWLVALGVAPVLLSLLPCLVMCGLGIGCMKMMTGAGKKQPGESANAAETAEPSAVAGVAAANEPSLHSAGCCHGGIDKTRAAHHVAALPPAGSR
jgi:hypothetical protein